MPRVFTEPRPYPLFRFPNRANSSLFIIFSLVNPLRHRALRHDLPFVALHRQLRLRPRSQCRRSCSATEQQAKRKQISPPSRHRRALVATSIAPPSRHRRASVAPSCAPPSCRLCCALFHASVAPSVVPSVVPPSPHFATVPHSHHLATNVALLLRVTTPASILHLLRHFQPPLHRQFTRGKFKTRYFFSVLYIFYDLGNCFEFS